MRFAVGAEAQNAAAAAGGFLVPRRAHGSWSGVPLAPPMAIRAGHSVPRGVGSGFHPPPDLSGDHNSRPRPAAGSSQLLAHAARESTHQSRAQSRNGRISTALEIADARRPLCRHCDASPSRRLLGWSSAANSAGASAPSGPRRFRKRSAASPLDELGNYDAASEHFSSSRLRKSVSKRPP